MRRFAKIDLKFGVTKVVFLTKFEKKLSFEFFSFHSVLIFGLSLWHTRLWSE